MEGFYVVFDRENVQVGFAATTCGGLLYQVYHSSFTSLTPRVKPWVIQSFLTSDSMDRTLKCDHSLESCCAVLYCGAVCFSVLDLALSGLTLFIPDIARPKISKLNFIKKYSNRHLVKL